MKRTILEALPRGFLLINDERYKRSFDLALFYKSIKEAVEDAGLTGFLFVTDDEYEPGMI